LFLPVEPEVLGVEIFFAAAGLTVRWARLGERLRR